MIGPEDSNVGHYLEKPGGIRVNGVPRQVPRPQDLPTHSIHHHTPKAFPFNVILSASRTSKDGFLSANGLPREYHGQYLSFTEQTLVELNPNILVRDVERMG